MKFPKALLLAACLFACDREETVEATDPEPNDDVSQLHEVYQAELARAETLRDPVNGWLTPDDCDGFLWTAKYAAAYGVTGVNMAAAEDPAHPGKFHRRPIPCWNPEVGDAGSKSTWSSDMGSGAALYTWRAKDLSLLQRHTAYGRAHTFLDSGIPVWQMGDPKGEPRNWYKPSLIGLLYQIEHALGGGNHRDRHWPNVYPTGLDDYQAHLQMNDILLRGEVAEATGDVQNMPKVPRPAYSENPDGTVTFYAANSLLDISETLFYRIEEHAAREPENPYYAYLLGVYTGNLDQAVALCLRDDRPVGSYVRCARPETCRLAEWLFACGNVLHRFGRI